MLLFESFLSSSVHCSKKYLNCQLKLILRDQRYYEFTMKEHFHWRIDGQYLLEVLLELMLTLQALVQFANVFMGPHLKS